MKDLLNFLLHPLIWLSSQANRARLRGARVEVIVVLLCRKPDPAVLLGQSHFHGIWMPPQEGVNLNESFPQAIRRCLEIECGFDLPAGEKDFTRVFHVRSIGYVGTLSLPEERQGERPVADDALGTPLEHVKLKKKAYWIATVLITDRSNVKPNADGKELTQLMWYSLADARQIIRQTNSNEKSELLMKCLDNGAQALFGASRGS